MMVRAYSSGVEHYVDIVGVPSSNLGTPTIIQNESYDRVFQLDLHSKGAPIAALSCV